jgi:outer membrane protein assembly factor BamB
MKVINLFFTIITSNFIANSQPVSWYKSLPNIGTFSSPRVSDLNGDGTKDIIFGAGKAEFQYSDSAVVALDGKTGNLLWTNSARDQNFISPGLIDIDKDGIQDVIVGGRSSELMALNGNNGKQIWRFDTLRYSENYTKRWFNFYNPQVIDDQNNDKIQDILISNGGDIWVPPFNPNRAAGRLVILSGADGSYCRGNHA